MVEQLRVIKMTYLPKYLIFLVLCLALCETCKYISKDDATTFEIHKCKSVILPLNETIAKGLRKLVLVENEFYDNFESNTFNNLDKLKYLELHENSWRVGGTMHFHFPTVLSQFRMIDNDFGLNYIGFLKKVSLTTLELQVTNVKSEMNNFNEFASTLLNVFIANTVVQLKWTPANDKTDEKLIFRNLTMRNCSLNEVAFHQLDETLTHLDVSRNKLKSFNGMRGLKQLREFNISHNLINMISEHDLPINTNLEILILNNNIIEFIAANSFKQNDILMEVVLSNNKLRHFYGIQRLSSLKYLFIDHNLITRIEQQDFSNMINLEKLILNDNLIDIIPANSFKQNNKLMDVVLSNNKLTPYTMVNETSRNLLQCLLLKDLPKTHSIFTIMTASGVDNVNQSLCFEKSTSHGRNYNSSWCILLFVVLLIISVIIHILQHRKIRMTRVVIQLDNSKVKDHCSDGPNNDYEVVEPHYAESLYVA